MEETDVQALFSYIKKRLPNCKAVPRLTKSLAAEWCRNFDGYTVEQMIQAVEKQTFLKSFWPDPEELMAHLPPRAAAAGRKLDPSTLKAATELPSLIRKLREKGYHDD